MWTRAFTVRPSSRYSPPPPDHRRRASSAAGIRVRSRGSRVPALFYSEDNLIRTGTSEGGALGSRPAPDTPSAISTVVMAKQSGRKKYRQAVSWLVRDPEPCSSLESLRSPRSSSRPHPGQWTTRSPYVSLVSRSSKNSTRLDSLHQISDQIQCPQSQ
jgi:hypothetical protein